MWNSLRLIVIITSLGIWQPYPTLESPYRVHLVLRDLTGRVDCVLLKRSSILSAEQYDHTVTDRDRSLKGMRSLKKKIASLMPTSSQSVSAVNVFLGHHARATKMVSSLIYVVHVLLQ